MFYRRVSCVGVATRPKGEQDVVGGPVRQVDRRAPLDRGRLTRKLDRVSALFHHHATLDTGLDVVAAAMTKRRQELVRRKQLDDAGVFWLHRSHLCESTFSQRLAKRFRR